MKKETKKEILSYIIIIIAVILIRTFIVTPVRVNGSSMDGTLKDGEIMILSKIDYTFNNIKRFDIVVVDHGNDRLIKRVIGLPNETVEWKDNVLYIDNKKVEETFLKVETKDFQEEKIPENCYFLVGDNREVSLDSRFYGCFDENNILGSANLVIFPFKDFGIKK